MAGLSIERLVPGRQSWFVLVALLALLALVDGGAARRLRVAHVILVVGGAFLLSRGGRFASEATLLALPLLATWTPPALPRAASWRPSRTVLLVLLGVMPFLTLLRMRQEKTFPFSSANLPVGIVTFLQRVGQGGTIFGFPDLAGYLEWGLPRYQVFTDLQTPFAFRDADTFVAVASNGDPAMLAKVVARHRPDFLIFSQWDPASRHAVDPRFGYRPVAFDWTTILYASNRSQPALVQRYALDAVDPFLSDDGPSLVSDDVLPRGLDELRRLAAVDPANGAVAVGLARLELAAGRPGVALVEAQRATQSDPGQALAWRRKGDALQALGRYPQAIAAYETARDRGAPDRVVGRQLWVCWTRLGDPRRAFRELDRAVVRVAPDTTFVDLLALGETAAAAGDRATAERDLQFALWKAPDQASAQRALEALLRIRGGAARPQE
jgi:hypothetical protein